jgi:acyl-CoA thioester hydrolase
VSIARSAEVQPPRTTVYPHRVRYLEVDQQGVAFNMWYLGYFDEAMAAFLEEGGLAYRDMLAAGFDVQLVHTEIDWQSSLYWQDQAQVKVELTIARRTSFDLHFTVTVGDRLVATGRTVYVVVATDGSGKRPIPDVIRAALGSPADSPDVEPDV